MPPGRNPDWGADSVALALWLAVIDTTDLTGSQIGRLHLALDTLSEADELLSLARSLESARDIIAAYAGVRAARKAASDLVAELTRPAGTPLPGKPGRPRKPAHTRHSGCVYEDEC